MKLNLLSTKIFTLILFTTLSISCKDKTKEVDKEETKKEISSSVYQCPMDCEKGKTYSEKGSCPVCKMDLAEVAHKAKECKKGKKDCKKEDCKESKCPHKGKCEKKDCKKEDCKKKDCKKEECKGAKSSECTKHSKDSKKDAACTCKDKKDCTCEEGKCKCPKCPEHS
ncbi:heavy metal-binding domain-containing protein [Maribacter sp.]|uniref:heavy metal-binding domain-containing protein n=1 Tax=Maribacter sp. TaxID=1897614 RepID=UPI0025B92FA9|nr:heavy metal-binding domain-containing protein [Maribacter sp.]